MAYPAYVTASTGASDVAGAWTATGAAPGAAGRIIILHVFQDGTTDGSVTFTSATNIENLAGTDNAWTSIGEFQAGNAESGRHYLWIGRSLSTSAPTFTGGNSSGEDLFFRMYEFSGVNTGTTLSAVIENSTAGTATGAFATSASVADVAVTTLGPERLALNFIAVDDDAQAAQLTAMTGETGGDWTYPVAAYGESAGTDATLALVTAQVASAGTIDGGTDAITSGGWSVVGFALIPEPPTYSQTSWRYYADGTESGSSTLAAQDANYTADVASGDVNLQLRIRMQNSNAIAGATTDDYQLQYEKNDSGTYISVGLSAIDSYPESNQDGDLFFSTSTVGVAQSFTGTGTKLANVKLYLKKTGSPTGNATVKLYAHTGTYGTSSAPTGAAIETSSTSLDVSTLTTSYQLIEFAFGNTSTLTNGTYYNLAIEHSGDNTNRIVWGADISSPAHGGNVSSLQGGSWVAESAADAIFYVYSISTEVVGYNSASLTDGNATTNRLGSGTGSFVAGEISEDGLVDNLQITASNYTELLYSLTIESTAVADNDTLDFRVLRNGATTGITYTVTPRIVINRDPALTQASFRLYADGTESGSSALAAQDANYTADISGGDVNLALRVRLQETNAGNGDSTDDYKLQFQINGAGSWKDVT